MFLKDIELTNFKCHKKLYLNFDTNEDSDALRKTTFLLGENGTGKSAFLKAVALVTAGSSALGDILGTPDDWIRYGEKSCEIKATLATAKGEERKISFKLERDFHLKDIFEQNEESLDLIDRAIKHADRNYFVVAYGASRRLNRDASSKPSKNISPRTTNIHSLFDPDASLISLSKWATSLDYSSKDNEKENKQKLETIKKALNSFLANRVKFKSIDRDLEDLIFKTPDGDVPLGQLSDGYQNVAAWVGDLLFNINKIFEDYKDPLKARGLLLIDEVDLHLHPIWQRRLHIFLRDKLPNFQIIATTHSPLTAQQAQEHELYALRRETKLVELIPFVGSPNKMLIHQILMSPVFGLPTDESVLVQEAKEKTLKLGDKKRTTKREKSILNKAEKVLENMPMNVRSNSILGENDLELLKTINKELKSKK